MSGERWVAHPIDAETLTMIREFKAAHPVESCDLFKTVTGRCTCPSRVPSTSEGEGA